MRRRSKQTLTRRGFLRALGRTAALGALAWLTVRLTARHRRTPDECTSNGICDGCGQFNHCRQPRACRARQRVRSCSS